ncbi:MAG: SDR family NAD(P)-dependent oxidoreductase [Myxococcota bacterium]
MTRNVAVITGASRPTGLGFATSRQLVDRGWTVFVTARERSVAQSRASELGPSAIGLPLDTTDRASREGFVAALRQRTAHLDALVHNASGPFDMEQATLEVGEDQAMAAFAVNVVGPWMLTNALRDLLEAAPAGHVVHVSSEAGSFGAPWGMPSRGPTLGAYGISKAALNALTVKLQAAFVDTSVRVNSVGPGFIATYPGLDTMGARPVEQGAASVVGLIETPPDGPRGSFVRDGAPLPW